MPEKVELINRACPGGIREGWTSRTGRGGVINHREEGGVGGGHLRRL